MQYALFLLSGFNLAGSLAGIDVIRLRYVAERYVALSGIALIGVAVFWMAPDLTESAGLAHALIAITVAFAALYSFDRYIHPICPCCMRDGGAVRRRSCIAIAPLATAICIHNLFDGWIASISGAAGRLPGSGILIALAAHKIPEAVLFGMMLRSASATARTAALNAVLTSSMILLGGLAQTQCDLVFGEKIMSVSLALACASFLLFGLKLLLRR